MFRRDRCRISYAFLIVGCSLSSSPSAPAQADENDAYVITRPERTRAAIDQIYAGMPPVTYQPPADRWSRLPRTARILKGKTGLLRAVMLGDSIVNDTSRSCWDDVLQRQYPDVKIVKTACVRGSTGCWWYKAPERIRRYVLDHHPDLLIIGGISHHDDIGSLSETIARVRAGLDCDVLLLTPAFGDADPLDDRQWRPTPDPDGKDFRSQLVRLANERRIGLLDMTAEWGRYIRASGK